MQEVPVLLRKTSGEVGHMEKVLREIEPPRMTNRLHIRLTEEEAKGIAAVAERYGVTKTAAARALIRLALETVRKD